jgi:hypothetical protein
MGLARGLSSLNTKKRKIKITKAKLQELELQWREHNRSMKRKGMHDLRYDTLDEYINYCYGKVKMPDQRDYRNFTPYQPPTSWRRDDHREKYPSAELMPSDGRGTKQERMKYTGTLVKGIATMHKSNAVPIISQEEATDIARMRRG